MCPGGERELRRLERWQAGAASPAYNSVVECVAGAVGPPGAPRALSITLLCRYASSSTPRPHPNRRAGCWRFRRTARWAEGGGGFTIVKGGSVCVEEGGGVGVV